LEARIIPQRIEHGVEPEQHRSEWYVFLDRIRAACSFKLAVREVISFCRSALVARSFRNDRLEIRHFAVSFRNSHLAASHQD
jgi:hypothetical protein